MNPLREDLNIIQQWIKPNSKVLDLGCGAGVLLKYLKEHKNVHGYGLEISPEKITACIQKGVNVIEQDLDKGLANFQNNSRDTVVMTDRKSTRLNSSHVRISYAVFCLKKKKKNNTLTTQ